MKPPMKILIYEDEHVELYVTAGDLTGAEADAALHGLLIAMQRFAIEKRPELGRILETAYEKGVGQGMLDQILDEAAARDKKS